MNKRIEVNRIKKSLKSCGEGLEVYGRPTIIAPDRLSLGRMVTLNDRCLLNASYSSITLGNNVTISNDAMIMAATLDISEFLHNQTKIHLGREISIGDNTWICAGAIILPGVTIKGDCVIAAGAVVCK